MVFVNATPSSFVVSSLSAELTNQKLISPGLSTYEHFGTAVAIDGNLAVIGAPASNVTYNDTPGKAYLYQRYSNGEWEKIYTFLPSVTNDIGQPPEFGSAVAISGDTVVIGARRTNHGTDFSAGCVYIFSADGVGGWTEQVVYEPVIGSTDWFGASVAISDEIIIIGSLRSGYNLGRPGLSGAAYVYTKTGETWNYAATLLASDPEYGASFGNAVAVDGTTAIVGAPSWGPSSTGAVYVFEADPDDLSNWEQSTRITSSETSNQFGWSVALSNDRIAVGSYQPGYVEIFERADSGPDNWGSVQLIDAGYYNQTFGYSLDLENNQLLIGAPLNPGIEIVSGAGSVHLYKHIGTSVGHEWNEVEVFYPYNDTIIPENARFGNSVALSRYTLLVGASYEDITTYDEAGSAYIITTLPLLGDIDNDGNINLVDTLLSLQIVSSIPPSDPVYLEADVNDDARIGLEEAIHGLQVTSGLKGIESETVATPLGNDVTVSALDFDLTFAAVTTEGDTTATLFATGPAPPEGFELAGSYFDISTSAEFTGPVQICFDYDDTGMSIAEEDLLQILHYEASGWQNRTKSLDTALNRICAEVSVFSNFALVFQIPPQIKYFSGYDTTHGMEPWKTDGTPVGTLLLKDIAPGNTAPENFFDFNGHVFFGYGLDEDTQLYRTDGTAAGTVPMNFTNPSQFLVFNDMLYFRADDDDPNTSYAAWYRSDGTDEGTVMLKDIWPAIGSFTYFFDRPTVAGSTLYFLADDGVHGYELWKLDSSDDPPSMVKDIAPAECIDATFYPRNLYPVDAILFFTANATSDCSAGGSLWKSDGTEAGTVLVSSNVIPQMTQFATVNSILYFAGYTSNTGIELWRSDGTDSGTALVKDIEPGSGSSNIQQLTEVAGTLYFQAFTWASRYELWKSDGTYNGTVLVKDIWSDTGSGYPQNLTNVDGKLYFSADDGANGTELWKSDGTVAGTVMVKDITPGSAGTTDMYFFTSLNGKLLFRANDSSHGRELWTSDGTAEGTFMLKDICAGTCDGFDGY